MLTLNFRCLWVRLSLRAVRAEANLSVHPSLIIEPLNAWDSRNETGSWRKSITRPVRGQGNEATLLDESRRMRENSGCGRNPSQMLHELTKGAAILSLLQQQADNLLSR